MMRHGNAWLMGMGLLLSVGGLTHVRASVSANPLDGLKGVTCVADSARIFLGSAEVQFAGQSSDSMKIVGLDGSIEDVRESSTTLEVIAHNGCDNFYDFVFLKSDLSLLLNGRSAEIQGYLSYFNADQSEETTTVLKCYLSNSR